MNTGDDGHADVLRTYRRANPGAISSAGIAAVSLTLLAASGLTRAAHASGPHAKGAAVFSVSAHAIASGGGASAGGVFSITGTIGQIDADPLHPAAGGVFAISGGIWPGHAPGAAPTDPVFANGFETPAP